MANDSDRIAAALNGIVAPERLALARLKEGRATIVVDATGLSAEERAALDASRAGLATAMESEDRDAINAAAEALETLSKPFAERRMDRGIREALAGKSVNELESRVGE